MFASHHDIHLQGITFATKGYGALYVFRFDLNSKALDILTNQFRNSRQRSSNSKTYDIQKSKISSEA